MCPRKSKWGTQEREIGKRAKPGTCINRLNVDHSGTQFFQDLLRTCEEHVSEFSHQHFFLWNV